jgi:hypothetical protein
MQRVLVVDKNKQPLMPCHPARARKLLKNGRAWVFRRYPFTREAQSLRVGSSHAGLYIMQSEEREPDGLRVWPPRHSAQGEAAVERCGGNEHHAMGVV